MDGVIGLPAYGLILRIWLLQDWCNETLHLIMNSKVHRLFAQFILSFSSSLLLIFLLLEVLPISDRFNHPMNDVSSHHAYVLLYYAMYFQVLQIARSVTKQASNDTAKDLFIKRLNESDMYFTDKPIPANESDQNAHILCSSVEGAMKYCPKRWEAMQKWFTEARRVSNEMYG